jgi:hypothetical protein
LLSLSSSFVKDAPTNTPTRFLPFFFAPRDRTREAEREAVFKRFLKGEQKQGRHQNRKEGIVVVAVVVMVLVVRTFRMTTETQDTERKSLENV